MRLIDADELKEIVFSKSDRMEDLWDTAGVLNLINNAPTVNLDERDSDAYESGYIAGLHDAIRPQGTWKRYMTGYQGKKVLNITFKCSECGRKIVYVDDVDKDVVKFLSKYPYCHCGAKMMKEENEDV
jgi:hypothetical protein